MDAVGTVGFTSDRRCVTMALVARRFCFIRGGAGDTKGNGTMKQTRDVDELRRVLRDHMPVLRKRYGVKSLGLFGSYVRGEAGPDSDLDLLVRFYQTPGLIGFVELENHLSDLLGLPVDLVMAEALKPNIGRRILAEVESL